MGRKAVSLVSRKVNAAFTELTVKMVQNCFGSAYSLRGVIENEFWSRVMQKIMEGLLTNLIYKVSNCFSGVFILCKLVKSSCEQGEHLIN